MIIGKTAGKNILALVIVLSFMFLRPGVFGQTNASVGSVLFLLAALFTTIVFNLKINGYPDYVFYFSLGLFWTLLVMFGLFGDSNLEFVIKALVSNFSVVIIGCFLALERRAICNRVLDFYLLILACCGYSSLITAVLYFSGVSLEQLSIAELEIGYKANSQLLFPFSVLYHDMNIGALSFPRFQHVFREAGIAQAFFIWAFVMAHFLGKDRWLLLGLMLGLLLTFSTSGIAITFIVLPLSFVAKHGLSGTMRRKLITIIMCFFFISIALGAGYYLALNAPYFGVMDKIGTHGASINDRIPDFNNISLLGNGLYSSEVSNSAVNLFKGMESIGVLSTLLYVFLFTFMCWIGTGKVDGFKTFIALLPLLITSAVAQPIVDAPLVYIVIFITRQTFNYPISDIRSHNTLSAFNSVPIIKGL
jgi:hypothetical protein